MPTKPRRGAPKRRKAAPRRRRPRWVLRVILMGGALFAVFCVAAGATIWLTDNMRRAPSPITGQSAETAERFTEEERAALDRLLKEQRPADNP